MDQTHPLNPTGHALLSACERAECRREPYSTWLLEDVLPEVVCDGVAGLPFAPPQAAVFDGRRETNNSTRVYFNPESQQRFRVCREVADGFRHPKVVSALGRLTGRDLSAGRLRIEYCLDVDGFWLEPHVDIPVKLFTMLVYLTDDADLRDAGTDVYDATPEHNLVARATYERNAGMIFIPGHDTWHGFARRPIRGVRKSLIINYVTRDWRAAHELA